MARADLRWPARWRAPRVLVSSAAAAAVRCWAARSLAAARALALTAIFISAGPENRARDTGSIWLTSYNTYGCVIQVKVERLATPVSFSGFVPIQRDPERQGFPAEGGLLLLRAGTACARVYCMWRVVMRRVGGARVYYMGRVVMRRVGGERLGIGRQGTAQAGHRRRPPI